MMDLGHLRSFVEVAERETVVAAANALGYTPPAVSQHIAKLERELDVPLFDRVGGRLSLSGAGTALLPIALEMLDLAERAHAAARQRNKRPHLVVSGFASALTALIIPILGALKDEMTLEIIEAEDADALRNLSLGHTDVVLTQEYVGVPSERDRRFHYTPVVTDDLRLIVPPSLPPSTIVADLNHSPWLVNGAGTRCEAAIQHILTSAGVEPAISGSITDNETLLALVAAGHGATIVPELLLDGSRSNFTVADQQLGVTRTILAVTRTSATNKSQPLLDHLMGDRSKTG